MACISCGVITSDWLWRSSNRCVKAPLWQDPVPKLVRVLLILSGTDVHGLQPSKRHQGRRRTGLKPELLAEVEPAHVRVGDDLVGSPSISTWPEWMM